MWKHNRLYLVLLDALLSAPSSAALSLLVQAVVHCGTKSSVHGDLVVPFARSATMQSRSFSVVGTITWNRLPLDLKNLQNGACSQFHQLLKTVLFCLAWAEITSEL